MCEGTVDKLIIYLLLDLNLLEIYKGGTYRLDIKDRIHCKWLQGKIVSPQEAVSVIEDGMTVAVSGYTPAGYPKIIPIELVKQHNQSSGESFKINLISGASVGPEIDSEMSIAGLIKRRIPFQVNSKISKLINQRKVKYVEYQLGQMSQALQSGFLGNIDIAIVEATSITKEGYIVPTTSVGLSPTFIKLAKAVIVEVNNAQPLELEGIHDIYMPALPPNRKPILLDKVNQRIGQPFIKVDPNKIKFIVESNIPDTYDYFDNPENLIIQKISYNLLNFLEQEIIGERLNKDLLPIQSGIGNLANGIIRYFGKSSFNNLEFYCGVIQEAIIELMQIGKVKAVSGGAFTPTPLALKYLKADPHFFKQHIVLRPADISNSGEVVSRLGVIALNNAIEVDIYGNANISHILASQVFSGIGGGSEFAKNAYISIILIPSIAKGGEISTIVPMVSHCDIIEHDVDIIITDIGVADLRGKDPVERANTIIENCAHQIYREKLKDYLNRAIKKNGGHQPHLLEEALSWHIKLQKYGSMKGVLN